MTRRYGRALYGTRIHEGVPAGRWCTLMVLGAANLSGWVAVMSVEAATDGDVFLALLGTLPVSAVKTGSTGR